MQLKPEALNALKLPVKVKAGFLGSVKLKVGGGCFFHSLAYVVCFFDFNCQYFCLSMTC